MSPQPSPRPTFDSYNPQVAAAMVAGLDMGGIPDYLGIAVTDVGPGWLSAEIDVRTDLLNPFGSAHGGTLAALADHVLGAVLYPLIPPGTWAATTELKLNFLAPVRGGLLQAHAEIISMSRRLAVVRIDAVNDGRLVGAAQGTVTITAPKVS
ncbi:MAG TPA: PaaI family thioesterase [Mycobacteriales bacterium]|jgi:uncharacterized protein (TIGR00369 family)|nr:PaaI family thioesterase [Mycobacteriales bacterium]HWC36402.1 PaaI family thioesterase [Mycobacteriales bacterium]